jgi:hypothetical protein
MVSFLSIQNPQAARRIFLSRSGLALSGAAVALLAGRDALAAKSGSGSSRDAQILNTALGAELEAIAAYQTPASSGPRPRSTGFCPIRFAWSRAPR